MFDFRKPHRLSDRRENHHYLVTDLCNSFLTMSWGRSHDSYGPLAKFPVPLSLHRSGEPLPACMHVICLRLSSVTYTEGGLRLKML